MAQRNIPNLFIIGAAKCATSSVHSYLAEHPDIFMSYLKEPGYFVEPEDRQYRKRPFVRPEGTEYRLYRNDMESYLGLFAEAGCAKIIGESSTGYTQLPKQEGVAKRIHDFNPQARLIYLMRDPVERTISHYWWHVQHESETRDLYKAITEDSHYRAVSNYALQLEPYFDLFDSAQILCLTVEELTARPEQVLASIFSWLDVDASFVPSSLQQRENVTPKVVIQPSNNVFASFRNTRLWEAMRAFTPRPLRALGRSLAERRIDTKAVAVKEVVEFLRPLQRPQVERLSRLLNRDFPQWKTLYANAAAEQTLDIQACKV